MRKFLLRFVLLSVVMIGCVGGMKAQSFNDGTNLYLDVSANRVLHDWLVVNYIDGNNFIPWNALQNTKFAGTGMYDTIPLSNLQNVNTFNLYNAPKQLENIDTLLMEMVNVERLACVGKGLTSVDVSNNIYLINIDLWENAIASIKFSDHPYLKHLDISDNALTTIDLSNCPTLEEFYCSDNSLDSIDISNNPKLNYFHCQRQSSENMKVYMTPEEYLASVSGGMNIFYTIDENQNYVWNPTYSHVADCKTKFYDVNHPDNILATSLEFVNAVMKGVYTKDTPVTLTGTNSIARDTELRRWISDHEKAFTDYGVTVENGGCIPFTPANLSALASITSLEITGEESLQSAYNITYMDDLLWFMPGLKHLNCSGNELATLNLSENQALESLNCTGNNLTYVDISTTKVSGSLGSFMGRKQARTFVMKVTCRQYTNMRRNSVLPYPNWTEFEFPEEEEACNDEPNPAIYRTIRLFAYEGLETNPPMGTHNIVSGENFSFKYYVKDGYSAENIKITTGNELYDEHITIVAENDGGFLVTIYKIRSMIEIHITGVEPESGVHNDFVSDENEPKVWTYGKTLTIYTPLATDIAIYDVKGIRYKQEFIPSGQTSYSLPKGLYIVRFTDNQTRKVVIY